MANNPGNTPFIKIEEIYTKLECTNPTGSIKDRIAKYIFDESEKQGLLKPGMTIIEATSGNTGIAFSYFAREKGYPIIIVMPEDMTEERKELIRRFGATLIECSAGNFQEAAAIRDKLAEEHGYFNPNQFANPLNVACHKNTTGQEILKQLQEHTSSPIDAFVAGVGTGGTLIGVGAALREKFPHAYLVAVEPSESPVMSGGEPGCHGINGIGDGFLPDIIQGDDGNLSPMIDDIICVSTEEARQAAMQLSDRHGICVGISSGANFLAAKQLQKKFNTVVTVFADGYYKYQSRGLTCCKKHQCPFQDADSLILHNLNSA